MEAKQKNVRRLQLIELSQSLKPFVMLGQFASLNQALIHHYKTQNSEITDFHSFKHWVLQGYKVKKGEKGYAIWTKPIHKNSSPEQPNPQNPTEHQYNVFGMCYVFSNLQVEKM